MCQNVHVQMKYNERVHFSKILCNYFRNKRKIERKERSVFTLLMLGHTQCINIITNVKIANSYNTTNTIQLSVMHLSI